MQLSKRLQAVADLVTPGNRVADIGCDHAYISIYLMEHHIASSVIAMDVNKGPLSRAKENIATKGLQSLIDTRLSDGLQKMKPGEADSILIAGMGGLLVRKILKEGLDRVQSVKELILQPQSEIHLVRKFLHEINFQIIEEQMLMDDGKYYVLMKAKKCNNHINPWEELHYQYGKILLENRNQVLQTYLNREKMMNHQIKENLLKNPTKNALQRLEEVNLQLELIESGLNYYR